MRLSSFAAMAALSGVHAHIFMRTPQPFMDGPGGEPLRSTSLGNDVNFPCQFGPDFDYPIENALKVTAGSSTPLMFNGSAIHGSGSCQVSLSKKASGDPKDWKVIHSIIGGCPGTSLGGNLNLDSLAARPNQDAPVGRQCNSTDTDDIDCLKTFSVPIPKDVASGKYFFAWTWFNKIGNREMYMQCAPIEVTGGSDSGDFLNKQPGIFYANFDKKPCETDYGYSLNFTQPGDSVLYSVNPLDTVSDKGLGDACKALYPPQKSQPAHEAFKLPGTIKNDTQSVHGTGSASGPSVIVTGHQTPVYGIGSVTATSVITTATVYASPSVFTPGASSGTSPPAFVTTVPVASAAGCANLCSEDGKVICLPSNNFGICNHGCAVAQALTAGTKCENGAIFGLTGKRSIKRVGRVVTPRHAVPKQFAD